MVQTQPETRHPKPHTPKPETRNPKPLNQASDEASSAALSAKEKELQAKGKELAGKATWKGDSNSTGPLRWRSQPQQGEEGNPGVPLIVIREKEVGE